MTSSHQNLVSTRIWKHCSFFLQVSLWDKYDQKQIKAIGK